MFCMDKKYCRFEGAHGVLRAPAEDEVCRKLGMLLEGECGGLGATRAARRFGYSKQRYYQLLHLFEEGGASALQSAKRGPKKPYRRTAEVVRQVIRYRFLDPDASAQVIAQRLRQDGWPVSTRSVERVIEEFGIQKKTPHVPS